MFREGRFDGETFTLTFADTGKWVFKPLNDRSVPGKIATIADRNAVWLTCDYNPNGKLGSISSQFGQSISVAYTGDLISSLTDHTGRSVNFVHYAPGDPNGNENAIASISCPQEIGQPPAAGPVTFTYTTADPDPRRNGNLLTATDGAGRLLGAFTYSTESNPLHIEYDSCATVQPHKTGHVSLIKREALPPNVSPKGGYTIFEVDEIGRVSETVCDRQHRTVSMKMFTGFSTPNVQVSSTENRPTGKLRDSDPDFFMTTCAYNADSLCTRLTHPDGSQQITTYDRDFRRTCPVREGGNPRVTTLRTPGGEERTVTCDYLPGFGTMEKPRRYNMFEGWPCRKFDGGPMAMDDWESPVVRMVTAHGQVTTCDYDSSGNLLAVTSPVPGRGSLYAYNPLGQLTSATTLNGPGSSFTDTCTYDGATSFLSSIVCDSGGLNLTTTCSRDLRGRVVRVIDPRGNDELCSYNALDQIVEIQSAPIPQRVATTFHYDAGASLARCDVEHRDSDGILDSANPAYSSFLVYDDHGLLVQTAEEERPVDGSSTLDPSTLGIQNFVVCDITLNNAGECTRLRTPAACRAQASDLVCDFSFDERGLLHRTHEGGTGNPDGLVSECDYDSYGAMTRCSISGQGITAVDSCSYDGFHRLATETDPMGNVCSYEYDNRGYVTCSVFGEVNDVPGSAGNVLLARGRQNGALIFAGYDYTELSRLSGRFSPRQMPTIASSAGRTPASQLGHNSGSIVPTSGSSYDSIIPTASNHAIKTKGAGGVDRIIPTASDHAIRTKGAGGSDRIIPTASGHAINTKGAGAQDRIIPAASDHAIKTKGAGGSDRMMNPFFNFETEDETITCDRFTPGGGLTPEVTTIDRSPAGLVMQVSCNGDLLETCSYDTAGRLTGHLCGETDHLRTLNPNGDVTSTTRTDTCPSDAAQTKTFTVSHVHDAASRITQTTDGTGNVSTCAYDSLHRPVSFTEPGGLETRCVYDGISSGVPFSEEISADAVTPGTFVMLSRSLVRSGEFRSSTDSYGHDTTYDADALGRMVRCDFPDGTFKTRGHVHVNIGTIGHVDHGRTSIVSDLSGRPVSSLTTSDPLNPPVSSTPPRNFTYDGLDRCTSVSQGVHIVACSHDSLSNLVSETQNGRVVSSTYSHRGRTGVTYSNGSAFAEQRDSIGRLVSVSALNAGIPVSPPVVVNQYAGYRISSSTQANGIVTTYQYRGDGEEAVPAGSDFTFDACTKVSVSDISFTTTRRDQNQLLLGKQMAFAAGVNPPTRNQTFVRNRLSDITAHTTHTREVAGGTLFITGEVSYTRDLEGRRLSSIGGPNPGAYEQRTTLPPGDQQMGQYSTWPRGPLEWDDNGNLISMATATGTLSLVHNVEGQLTSVSRAGVPVISYDYDPIGRCISRDPEIGPATTFVYDGDACIQELGEDGLPDLTHVLADGVRQCISTRNGTIYYPHGGAASDSRRGIQSWEKDCYEKDRLSRVSLVSNSLGLPVERYDCDDAGKPIFLNSTGLPTGATQSTIPLRWMAPDCSWESEIGMFQSSGGFHSPDLGTDVSSHKIKVADVPGKKYYVGHVTLIKQ